MATMVMFDDDNDDDDDNEDDNDDDGEDIESSVMCAWQPISGNHQKQHIFSFAYMTMMMINVCFICM